MNELTALIERIQQGETEAYTPVIEQFQDMAVGYAYAVLGDLALAEDVAQEAFIAAYYTITSLREPALRLVRQKIVTRPSQPVGSIPSARDPHSNAVAWQRRYCSLG